MKKNITPGERLQLARELAEEAEGRRLPTESRCIPWKNMGFKVVYTLPGAVATLFDCNGNLGITEEEFLAYVESLEE